MTSSQLTMDDTKFEGILGLGLPGAAENAKKFKEEAEAKMNASKAGKGGAAVQADDYDGMQPSVMGGPHASERPHGSHGAAAGDDDPFGGMVDATNALTGALGGEMEKIIK